jgi:Ras-related protein Rab-1A
VDFKIRTIEMDGLKVKLQIWCTAGQERFRTITDSYYRGAHAIMLVYDIANEISFANVKQWRQEIDRYACSDVKVVLLGNRCHVSARKVESDKAAAFAKDLGMPFFECSAKTNHNVEEAFRAAVKAALGGAPSEEVRSTQQGKKAKARRCCLF